MVVFVLVMIKESLVDVSLLAWILFHLFVFLMLAIDLGIFHKKAHDVTFKEALTWSLVWFSLAMVFNIMIFYWKGPQLAVEFFTGYLIEKSLSVDNIFIFLLIFNSFKIPSIYQHRILFWGILGALVMRAVFIAVGITLIAKFHWILYLFGFFLIFTGLKMLFHKSEDYNPQDNPILKLAKRFFPFVDTIHGDRFLVSIDGKTYATPLLLVLILIETSDLLFAVDSIPAILAISRDSFIVYTSNIFAIMGLRSLYFAVGGLVNKFYYLHFALAFILTFIGIKMLVVDLVKIPTFVSLGVIVGCLLIAILASIRRERKKQPQL
jgi:tellurite resistance protein TerC